MRHRDQSWSAIELARRHRIFRICTLLQLVASYPAQLLAQNPVPPHQSACDSQNPRSEAQKGPEGLGCSVELAEMEAGNPEE